MQGEEEKGIGGCSCVWMARGSCGEGRQKLKAGQRQEKAFLGYKSEGGIQQSWETQGAWPGRAGMHGAGCYRDSGLSSTYRTPDQQSWEGRRGQEHGAGCAAARSGSRQRSTGTSHRYGVERDGSCSGGRELTTAASGKGWRELPVGQKLQQTQGKVVPLQHRLHRDRGVTQGVKQSIPGAGGGGGCGVSGRENVWGQGASKHSCSMKTGPARRLGIYLAEKTKAGCPGL